MVEIDDREGGRNWGGVRNQWCGERSKKNKPWPPWCIAETDDREGGEAGAACGTRGVASGGIKKKRVSSVYREGEGEVERSERAYAFVVD